MSDRAPLFSSEDQEADHYLRVLRDGSPQDQVLARDRLSHIFERRGMVEQAVELLESNHAAGLPLQALRASVGAARQLYCTASRLPEVQVAVLAP